MFIKIWISLKIYNLVINYLLNSMRMRIMKITERRCVSSIHKIYDWMLVVVVLWSYILKFGMKT